MRAIINLKDKSTEVVELFERIDAALVDNSAETVPYDSFFLSQGVTYHFVGANSKVVIPGSEISRVTFEK